MPARAPLIGAGAGLIAGTAIGADNARHAASDVERAYADAYYACMDEADRPADAGYAYGAPPPGYGYGYGPPPPPPYYGYGPYPYPYPYPYYGPEPVVRLRLWRLSRLWRRLSRRFHGGGAHR